MIENYSIFGGLPLVATMKTDEQKSKYLSDQIEKVYLKDIIKRNNIKSENRKRNKNRNELL